MEQTTKTTESLDSSEKYVRNSHDYYINIKISIVMPQNDWSTFSEKKLFSLPMYQSSFKQANYLMWHCTVTVCADSNNLKISFWNCTSHNEEFSHNKFYSSWVDVSFGLSHIASDYLVQKWLFSMLSKNWKSRELILWTSVVFL